jgi:hypothetical protein
VTSEAKEELPAAIAHMTTVKWIAIGSLLLAATSVALAALALARVLHVDLPAGPAVLDATELTIRDADGNVRGRWTFQGVSVVDKRGRVRAALSVGDEGAPNVTLFSRSGGVRAVIGLGAEDTPGITLHDEKSRVRTRIIVGAEDAPSVIVADQNGNVVGRLPAPITTPAVGPALKGRKGR